MAAVKAVQGYVSNLRKVLGAAILLTRGRGYTIQTQPRQVDVDRFGSLVRKAGVDRFGSLVRKAGVDRFGSLVRKAGGDGRRAAPAVARALAADELRHSCFYRAPVRVALRRC